MVLPLRTEVTQVTAVDNDRVLTPASTVDVIPNFGKSLLTSTAAKTYIMAAPQAGVRKVIVQTTTSTAIRTIQGPTTTVVFNVSGHTTLTFDTAGELIELEGRTPLIWDIISNQNSVGTA